MINDPNEIQTPSPEVNACFGSLGPPTDMYRWTRKRPAQTVLTSGDRAHRSNICPIVVRLHAALSSNDSAFAKLARYDLPATGNDAAITPLSREDSAPYRPYRKLTGADLKELSALYEAGESMPKLAQKFECHRQTIARQLRKAGVQLRPQQVRSPEFDLRARVLYEQNNSLDEVAEMLGVQASTINRAVKAAGGRLRPQGHQPRGG